MIRVLLADDETSIRTALASLLAIPDDLEVVAQAASGDEALAMAPRTPDVAVLDLQMPGLDGIAVAGTGHRAARLRQLILTSYGRPGHLERALAAASAGSCPRPSRPRSSPTWCWPCPPRRPPVNPDLAADAPGASNRPLTPPPPPVLELAAGSCPRR